MRTYRYESVPLTPAVFAYLLLDLHPGSDVLARQQMIEEVVAAHERQGGVPARGSVATVAKKALASMVTEGRIVQVSHGFWRTSPATDPASVSEPITVGEGPESVYVYYFPAYRDQAAYLGNTSWPMKIGRTVGEPAFRVKEQSGTSMPEQPIVGMVYKTADSSNAEKLLHSALKERGLHLSGAPGKEWFTTSLTEVRQILDFVVGR